MNDPFNDDGASEPLDFELDVDPAEVKREQEARPMPPSPPVEMPATTPAAVPPANAPTPSPAAWVPPPTEAPSNLRTFVVLGLIGLVLAVNVYIFYWDDWFPPDPADLVARLSEDSDGVLLFDGKTYRATWNMEPEVQGYVNQLGRAHMGPAEFITHQLVLVTGEYADPSKVEISDIDDGTVVWKAPTKPRGTIELVYIIPADATALAEMKKLTPGAWVFLDGDLLEGPLVTPDDVVLKTLGDGKIMRLRAVSVEDPPEGR